MASPTKEAASDAQPAAGLAELDQSLGADLDIDMSNEVVDADEQKQQLLQQQQQQEGNDPVSSLETMKDDGDVRQEALDLTLEEARIPLRKDISLREFLSKMDDYAPVIPDAVTFHALTLAGLPPPPLSSLNPQAPQSQTQTQTQTQSQTQTTPQKPSNAAAAAASTSSAPQQQQQTQQTQPTQPPLHTAASTTSSEPHTPLHLSRLLALATQKFIADIAADAYQYSRMRSGTLTSNTLAALSNQAGGGGAPGAVPGAPAAGGAGAGGGGPSGGGSGGGGGGGGAAPKGGAGQHVLGMQRPGFGGGGQGGGQGRTVLTMEDLGMAVSEYGVNVKRGEFYR